MREARRAFEAALDIQRNAICQEPEGGSLIFGAATTLCNLGHLYSYRGLDKRASIVLSEAASLQAQVIGDCHPTVLSTLDSLADSYAKSKQHIAALTCYKNVLSRIEGSEGGSNSYNRSGLTMRKKRCLAILHYKMSRMYRKQNDYDAAYKKLKESHTYVCELKDPDLLTRVQSEIDDVEHVMKSTKMNWV